MKNVIHISLPKFMAAWLVNDAGGCPVSFTKNSVEFLIMEQFSVSDPALSVEIIGDDAEQMVPVIMPKFKYKDDSYHFLTEKGRKALESCIKDRFNIALWKALHKFGHIGKNRAYLILAWMEANGIPDDGSNWDAIEKRYQRLRNAYLSKSRQKKTRDNKKNH
ncbi:MAG: hypothetical protein NC095_07840 [Muribaculum sp.]|nr:hypothetical protein [Muribaculum sp.]